MPHLYMLDFDDQGEDPAELVTKIVTELRTNFPAVTLEAISFRGPGGGNPCAVFMAEPDDWRQFVLGWYCEGSKDSLADYGDEILEPWTKDCPTVGLTAVRM